MSQRRLINSLPCRSMAELVYPKCRCPERARHLHRSRGDRVVSITTATASGRSWTVLIMREDGTNWHLFERFWFHPQISCCAVGGYCNVFRLIGRAVKGGVRRQAMKRRAILLTAHLSCHLADKCLRPNPLNLVRRLLRPHRTWKE